MTSRIVVLHACCTMVLGSVIGVAGAEAAYLDSSGSFAPTVGQDLLPAPVSSYPRDNLDYALCDDTTSIPTQSFSWSGTSYIDSSHVGHTTSTISSRSSMGSLGAYAHTVASVVNGGYVRGSASSKAYFRDTFTIHAPVGMSTATLNFRLNVHGVGTITTTGVATFTAQLHVSDAFGYPIQINTNSYQGVNVTVDQSAALYVGRQYTIVGELQANAIAIANLSQWENTPNASAEMNASNTSSSYIWSDDPGVYIETISGATYQIPEPTSLAAVILGAGVLLGRRRLLAE